MLPLAQLLAELVRRPSVNPMGRTDLPAGICLESRVIDFLEEQLRILNVPYTRMPVASGRDNLVATYSPPTPAPIHLLYEAHVDTVPVDGMTVDPFAAEVRDGRLYGRGACDVKAGVAAMLAAFGRLATEEPLGSAQVTLAFVVDEEHTFLGVQDLVKTVKADFAVVAEPTLLNIVTAHKGVVRWRLTTKGRACHSSRPQDGENAIYLMAQIVGKLKKYAGTVQSSRADRWLGAPTMCIGRIEGGTSSNTVPDSCTIDIDRRLVPGETAMIATTLLTKALTGHEYTLKEVFACPPLSPVRSDHPILHRLGHAINSVVGSHRLQGEPYGTDAATIAAAGIPSVVFGPGDIAQAHTADEWVELAQVEQAAEILFRFAVSRS